MIWYLANMIVYVSLFVIAHGKDNCQTYLSLFEARIVSKEQTISADVLKKLFFYLQLEKRCSRGHSPQNGNIGRKRENSIR